jgi:hypothetical protein
MIVGLVGFIGCGKGTAGDILKDFGFQQISFAGGVKDIAAVMFDWPREYLEGDTSTSREWREQPDKFWSKKFGKDFTPRLALQLLGTEVGRGIFHENFWVDRLERLIDREKNYVITDVRFQNEIDFVHKSGGVMIEVRRGISPHWYEIASQANRGSHKAESFMYENGPHESEWRWIGGHIDHTIDNDGTVEDLKNNLIKCLTRSYGSNTISELTEGVS